MTIVVGCIALLVAFDYFRSLRRPSGLHERALFFYWSHTSRAVFIGFWLWLVIACITAFAQWRLQADIGLDALVQSYGLIYERARSGELWRVVTGPFFHSGPPHFLNNAFTMLFIGPIAWALYGRMSLLLFLLTNIVGAVAQMSLGPAHDNGYLGMSGGVFAYYGALIGAGLRDRHLFPEGFTVLCAGVAAIAALGSALLSANAANVSHAAGFVAGLAFAALALPRCKVS
jgi:membrane associated rhomboid family serine protease